eukprot:s2372_g3.t1
MDVLLILVLDVMGRPCCVKISSRRRGTSHKPTCVGNHADFRRALLYTCGRQASFSAKFAANPLILFSSTEPEASKDPLFQGTPVNSPLAAWLCRLSKALNFDAPIVAATEGDSSKR